MTADGSLVGDLVVAAGAGLVGFASPCVVPLVPGYLAYLLGLSGTGEAPGEGLRGRLDRALVGPLLFVAGFSSVFITQGALFGGLGGLLVVHARLLQAVAGGFALILAVVYSGLVLAPQQRALWPRRRFGVAAAPVL